MNVLWFHCVLAPPHMVAHGCGSLASSALYSSAICLSMLRTPQHTCSLRRGLPWCLSMDAWCRLLRGRNTPLQPRCRLRLSFILVAIGSIFNGQLAKVVFFEAPQLPLDSRWLSFGDTSSAFSPNSVIALNNASRDKLRSSGIY